jgi:hypothetical protein
LGLKTGDIFKWDKYPLYVNELKDRWLLYLGNQSIEAMVYQITTTTKYEHYEDRGDRTKNNYFRISKGIGGLEQDSIVDFTKYFEIIPESIINNCVTDIHKKGSLNQDNINRVVKHIKNDKNIQTKIKKDIYKYLRESKFTVND